VREDSSDQAHTRRVIRSHTFLAGVLTAVCLVLSAGPAHAAGTSVTSAGADSAASAAAAGSLPAVRHVFVINIENKGYTETWGAASKAPYLATTLRAKGVLLSSYYGTAHNSQPNYVAQISGQGPDSQMQADCKVFSNFAKTGTADPGQLRGNGCVFPRGTPSIAGQLDALGLSWKGYMDDMGTSCRHPVVGRTDPAFKAKVGDQYATRHNPFVYFHSVIDHPTYCKAHVVGLRQLTSDLAGTSTTPNLSYITPDLCNDGHDAPCVDGRKGGLVAVDAWMRTYVPKILASPAFQANGLLVITADESDGASSDSRACCNEGASTNSALPGIKGKGGGRIGALVISPFTRAGTSSTTPYNHYSLLGSVEDLFGLAHIGYARTTGLNRFGADVYSN
jgi:hypothetical protein